MSSKRIGLVGFGFIGAGLYRAIAEHEGLEVATAAIHLVLRLNTLLCGILVLTMLFSINIRIMGKPNIGLFAYTGLFTMAGPLLQGLPARIVFVALLVLAAAALLYWFLKTEAGMALRAVGASQTMARAQGISVGFYTLLGLGLAGALCAGSGALMAQNQAFADVNMGFGTLVNGLAAVIVASNSSAATPWPGSSLRRCWARSSISRSSASRWRSGWSPPTSSC